MRIAMIVALALTWGCSKPPESAPKKEGAPSTQPAAGAMSEEQKVMALADAVRNLEGAVFIRNGTEHTPADAADHMMLKWGRARGASPTAEQFIASAASKSSISGQPYHIRLKDGTTITSEQFLREQLVQLAKTRPAPARTSP